MTIQRWTTVFLLSCLGLTASTARAENELYPSPVLVVDGGETATPEDICQLCVVVKPAETSTHDSADVILTHTDAFQGDVELVLWLDSDVTVSVWLEDVSITAGQTELVVTSGQTWAWADVRYAWARYYSF